MGLVSIVILEGLVEDTTDLEAIREAALDRCHESAENRNIYDRDVLENLFLYRQHEPEPEEVSGYLIAGEIGNWRAVAKMAALLATHAHLAEEIDEDLSVLERAIQECRRKGYDMTAILYFCPNGWTAHEREESWETGALHEWPSLNGGERVTSLRVPLSSTSEVWLDLVRSELRPRS